MTKPSLLPTLLLALAVIGPSYSHANPYRARGQAKAQGGSSQGHVKASQGRGRGVFTGTDKMNTTLVYTRQKDGTYLVRQESGAGGGRPNLFAPAAVMTEADVKAAVRRSGGKPNPNWR